MLSSEEIAQLAGAICATAETLGQTISATAAELMAGDLAEHSPTDIRSALQSCRRELAGKFTLAAVLQRIHAEDGRPAKDEAWSIALSASDEFDTVVLTDEIQVALQAAKPVLDLGDKVGARMAFISAYERLVNDARAQAVPVNWHVSIGYDAARRVEAITKALQMQRIPLEHAQKYVAELNYEAPTEDGRAIAGLLTGRSFQPSAAMRGKLKAIKDGLAARQKEKEDILAAARSRQLEDLERRRSLQLQLIEEAKAKAVKSA